MPLPVYVLVGGASRRFGADKATTLVDGDPWALHVGQRLAAPGAEIVLVGKSSGSFGGVRRIDDAPEVAGPLAGVLAALADRGDGLLALASCDLVRPERDWLAPLVALHEADATLGVAAYRTPDRWQPFPSVAHPRWLATLAEQAATGVGSLQAALDSAKSAAITWPGATEGPPQANTPETLREQLQGEP